MLPTGTYQVRVLDNVGREVLRTTGEDGSIGAFDTRALANGIYLVQARGTNGLQFIKRLVKE